MTETADDDTPNGSEPGAVPADLVSLRRDFHRHPEPAWCEFYTTTRIGEELADLPGVGIEWGPDVVARDERLGVPDADTMEHWRERARAAGVEDAALDRMVDGRTGLVATLEGGEGPTVALRVDIDALSRRESTADDHQPVAEGFRPAYDDAMHACGHDAHATIGIGVLRRLAQAGEFPGTLKVLFQPAEEVVGGGRAMARGGALDDVDYLLAIHVGLDHPTGEIVAGVEGFLAVSQFEATFEGDAAHAGGRPDEGNNAIQAMAAAVQNLYAIPRHQDGATRVNAGTVSGGTATNIIPEAAVIEGEVRGETTELMEYMRDRAHDVLEGAAAMHRCDVEVARLGEAPSAHSDDPLRDIVAAVGETTANVELVLRDDELGGSEDATYLMRRVQENGGLAAYVGLGTDHPGGHHTATFDVDEETLAIGVDVVSESLETIARKAP